ncbi:Gellan lyase precursor [compost metagenome]
MKTALQTFQDAIIKATPGDVNNDNKFTIGDLAIIASAYGKTSSDSDWAQYKKADVNGDGKVDIEDLAFVARLILAN